MITEIDSYPGVPKHHFESLKRYVSDGVRPGSFLRACLENDLIGAVCKADAISLRVLPAICALIYNQLPARSYGICWGSPERVDEWILRFAKLPQGASRG